MGGSQSQDAAEPTGGTSPTKSPTKAGTTTGGSQMNADAAAFLPDAVSVQKAAPAPGESKGEKPKKEAPTGSQICVRNLAKDTKEEDLRKQFEEFGKITDIALKTLKNGQGKGYGFITFTTLEEAKKAIEGMHEKPQAEGKKLLVTMATRQPGEAKGKGKDGGGEKGDKGKGKGTKGKGKAKGQQGAGAGGYQYPYGYYPYSQEQIQNAWAMHMQYYQQALQAQAYYSGFTGGVIPSEAAIVAAASTKKESPAVPAPASDKEYIGQVMKSISAKNGYGFITCNETKVAYGRDVFVDAALLPEIEVKAKVSFTVELSEKGHPRASKVTKIADAEN